MLYEKNFFTFRRYSRKTRQSTNSRIDTLLSQCGLEDRLLTGTEEAAACVRTAIDYAPVRSRIEKIRRFSWKYLSDAMQDRTDTDIK